MVSVHHERELVYVMIPKSASTYVSAILSRYYGFRNYTYRRRDHDAACFVDRERNRARAAGAERLYQMEHEVNPLNRSLGFYRYFSEDPDERIMPAEEWARCRVFSFVREPRERLRSAHAYLRENWSIPEETLGDALRAADRLSDYEFGHLLFPQHQHLVDHNGRIVAEEIGRVERLEEDMCRMLRTFDFEIVHPLGTRLNAAPTDRRRPNETEKDRGLMDFWIHPLDKKLIS
jgi:hypothetical protein